MKFIFNILLIILSNVLFAREHEPVERIEAECTNCGAIGNGINNFFKNTQFDSVSGSVSKSSIESIEKEFVFRPDYKIKEYRGSFTASFQVPIPSNLLSLQNLEFVYTSQSHLRSNYGVGFELNVPRIQKDIILNKTFLNIGYQKYEFVNYNGDGVKVEKRIRDLTGQEIDAHYRLRDESKFWHLVVLKLGKFQYGLLNTNGEVQLFDQLGRMVEVIDIHKNKLFFAYNQCNISNITNNIWKMSFSYSKRNGEHYKYGYACNNDQLLSIVYDGQDKKKINFEYVNNFYLKDVRFDGSPKSLFNADYRIPEIKEEFFSNDVFEKDHVYVPWEKGIKKFKTKLNKFYYTFFFDVTGDGLPDKIEFDLIKFKDFLKPSYENGPPESKVKFSPLKIENGKFEYVASKKDTILNNSEFFKSEVEFVSNLPYSYWYNMHDYKSVFFDLNNDGRKEYIRCYSKNNKDYNLVVGANTFTSQIDYKPYRNHINKDKNNLVNYLPNTVKWTPIDLRLKTCGKAQVIDINLDGIVDIVVSNQRVFFGSLNGFHERDFSKNELKDIYGFDVDDKESEDSIWLSLSSDFKYEKKSKLQFLKSPITGNYYKITDSNTKISHPDKEKLVLVSLNSDLSGSYDVSYKLNNGVIVVDNLKIKEAEDNFVSYKYIYKKMNIDPFKFYNLGFTNVDIIKTTKLPLGEERVESIKTVKEFTVDLDLNAILFDERPRYDGLLKLNDLFVNEKFKEGVKNTYEVVKLSPNRFFQKREKEIKFRPDIDGSKRASTLTFTPANLILKNWFVDSNNNYLLPKSLETYTGLASDFSVVFNDGSDKTKIKKDFYSFNFNNYLHKVHMSEMRDSFKKEISKTTFYKLDPNNFLTQEKTIGENSSSYIYDVQGRKISENDGKGQIVKMHGFYNGTNVPKKISSNYNGDLHILNFDSVFNRITELEDKFGNVFNFKLSPWGMVTSIYKNAILVKELNVNFANSQVEDMTNGHRQIFELNGLGYVKSLRYDLPGSNYKQSILKSADGHVFQKTLDDYVVDYTRYFNGMEKDVLTSTGNKSFFELKNFNTRSFLNDELITESEFYFDGILKSTKVNGDEYSLERDNLDRIKRTWTTNDDAINFFKKDIDGRVTLFLREIYNDPMNQLVKVTTTFNDADNIIENSLGARYDFRSDGQLLSYNDQNVTVLNNFDSKGLVSKNLKTENSKIKIDNTYNQFGSISKINHFVDAKDKTIKSEFKFYYDRYDRIQRLSVANVEEFYSFKNGFVESISPYINKVSYNSLGKIAKVQYSNGVVKNIYYNTSGSFKRSELVVNGDVHSYEVTYKSDKYLLSEKIDSKNNISKDYNYKNFSTLFLARNEFERIARDTNGQLQNYKDFKLNWSGANLIKLGQKEVTYDDSGRGILFKDNDKIIYRLDEDTIILNDKLVRRIKLEGMVLGFVIGAKFYPSLTDVRESPILLSDDKEVLFEREYNEFGGYELHCYTSCDLDKDLLFGFSQMIKPFIDLDLHWSNTRVYSTSLRQWLSIDPMLYWNPDVFEKEPENWHGYKYCDDDPVNCVDPSGYYSQELQAIINESYGRNEPQRAMNAVKDAAKTFGYVVAGGAAVGSIATVGPVIAPMAGELVLNIGARMVLNPGTTAALGGVGSAVLDRSFNLKTGFPNMDPIGAFSEFLTNQAYDFADNLKSDFSSLGGEKSSPSGTDFFKGSNPYSN